MSSYHKFSEYKLIQYLKKGDDGAFTEIYNRFWEKLLAIGFYYTHDKHEAKDVVHEVMLSLWTRRNEVEIQSLQAYLATAVKFAVFKSIARSQKRRKSMEHQPNLEFVSDIEEKLEARFLEEYLRGVVEELPEKAKLVFSYSREQEFSVKQIAAQMDLSPKAVEYHMTKALTALRKALQKIKCLFV